MEKRINTKNIQRDWFEFKLNSVGKSIEDAAAYMDFLQQSFKAVLKGERPILESEIPLLAKCLMVSEEEVLLAAQGKLDWCIDDEIEIPDFPPENLAGLVFENHDLREELSKRVDAKPYLQHLEEFTVQAIAHYKKSVKGDPFSWN